MEAFVSRKKRRISSPERKKKGNLEAPFDIPGEIKDESTEVKIAMLASLYSFVSQDVLLDCLISSNGSIEAARSMLNALSEIQSPTRQRSDIKVADRQSSLRIYEAQSGGSAVLRDRKSTILTKKGQTLHLYTPEDIALYTPCSIIHNFLPLRLAEDLLKELLDESPTFERQTFKLFENVVQSPHSACFYVESLEERKRQSTEYLYNGSYLTVSQQGPQRWYLKV